MVFLAENEVTFPLCEIVQASLSSVLLASPVTLAHKCVRVLDGQKKTKNLKIVFS